MFYGGRTNYDELHREILLLKQSKAELERSRDEAVSRSRDLEMKYQDLLLELKQLNVSDNNKLADLECQLKLKSYELDRCALVLGETDAKYKYECTEKDKLARRIEVLREELTREQAHSQKIICSLKLEVQDKSRKLSNYERLETELDKIIIRAASLPNPDDAEKILSCYEKEAFIPLNSKRRLEQSLNLARRILELENLASELKNDLFRERDMKTELQNELTATKACLDHLDHPTSELISLVMKRNLEVQKLRNNVTALAGELLKLKQNECQLRKDLAQVSSHGQQLGAIRKMITNLSQQSTPHETKLSPSIQKSLYKMQGKTKVHWKSDVNTQIPSPEISNHIMSPSKKVIHIKKPITFSKMSPASLTHQFGSIHKQHK